jgi:hypothetical protein
MKLNDIAGEGNKKAEMENQQHAKAAEAATKKEVKLQRDGERNATGFECRNLYIGHWPRKCSSCC